MKGLDACLYCVNPSIGEQWLVSGFLEHTNQEHPHVGGDLIEMTEIDDDRLLRSEVLCLVTLMIQKFIQRSGLPHRLHPVR